MAKIDELREIMQRLRDPDSGCPWDLAQTMASIVPHTLEEAYEVADAVARGDPEALRDELGDLLFQVLFLCQLAEEKQAFALNDVMTALRDKLVRRHPHVFGDEPARSMTEHATRWEALKAEDRLRGPSTSELDDVPRSLPALARAAKLQKRAARVGFDWPTVAGALEKFDEECEELHGAIRNPASQLETAEELGDALFALVNVARKLHIDAEGALRAANDKFDRRFRHIEARLRERARSPHEASLQEMDALWDEAKQLGY
jgi:MazG family protein